MYNRFHSTDIRVGKLLENMDGLAADVAYKYVKGTDLYDSSAMVTALVDNINFQKSI